MVISLSDVRCYIAGLRWTTAGRCAARHLMPPRGSDLTRLYAECSLALRLTSSSGKTPAHRSRTRLRVLRIAFGEVPSERLSPLASLGPHCVRRVCPNRTSFLYDAAPSAISSAELRLAYLYQCYCIDKLRPSFALVPEDQKASIKTKMEQAERDLDVLISDIGSKGYTVAVNYLERAKHAILEFWRFNSGHESPEPHPRLCHIIQY